MSIDPFGKFGPMGKYGPYGVVGSKFNVVISSIILGGGLLFLLDPNVPLLFRIVFVGIAAVMVWRFVLIARGARDREAANQQPEKPEKPTGPTFH